MEVWKRRLKQLKEYIFNKEQLQQIEDWHMVHWKKGKRSCVCEVCGKSNINLFNRLVRIVPEAFRSTIEYPCFMVMCNICGNIKLFNAMVSGVYSSDDDKAKEEPAPIDDEDDEPIKVDKTKKSFWKRLFG